MSNCLVLSIIHDFFHHSLLYAPVLEIFTIYFQLLYKLACTGLLYVITEKVKKHSWYSITFLNIFQIHFIVLFTSRTVTYIFIFDPISDKLLIVPVHLSNLATRSKRKFSNTHFFSTSYASINILSFILSNLI